MNLKKLKQVDPKTVNRDSLVDISTISIDTSLPKEEQIRSYLKQIRNPYLFLCHGVMVEIVYADSNQTIEDQTERYIRQRQKQEYEPKYELF